MTRNEVIKHLKFIKEAYENLIKNDVREGTAISKDFEGEWKADQPLTQFYDTMTEALTLAIEFIVGMATDDCISRRAVLDYVDKMPSELTEDGRRMIRQRTLEEYISDTLPPVMSQPKMGRWIRVDKDKLKCSECGVIHLIAQYPVGKIDWCPNCGAKMRGGRKEMAKFLTYEEMGKKIAEKALDEVLYDGRSIREWVQIIASEDAISRKAVIEIIEKEEFKGDALSEIEKLSPVAPQQKIERCKGCKYFEYDSVAKVDGIPLIAAHEICSRWGHGCKTKEDGYCFLFEPQPHRAESEVEE